MKKIISTLLVATLICSQGMIGFASSNETNIPKTNLETEYGVKIVDKIPEGVQPLVFETEADLIKYLNENKNVETTQVMNINLNENDLNSINNGNMLYNNNNDTGISVMATGTRTERVETRRYLSVFLDLMLYAYLNIDDGKIVDVKPGISLTGWTPGIDLNRSSIVTNYTISSSGYSTHISGECDVDHYAVINVGQIGIKLHSTHYQLNIYHGL